MPVTKEVLQNLVDGIRREAAFLSSHQPDMAGRTTVAERLDALADAAQAELNSESEAVIEGESADSASEKPGKVKGVKSNGAEVAAE